VFLGMAYDRIKYVPTVKMVPDKLWDEIMMMLPQEKSANPTGCPIVSSRRVPDDIIFVSRSGRQWKVDIVKRTRFRFRRFQQWSLSEVFKKLGTRLLRV
jgi:transposase